MRGQEPSSRPVRFSKTSQVWNSRADCVYARLEYNLAGQGKLRGKDLEGKGGRMPRQMQNVNAGTVHAPSTHLLDLCRAYLELVDHGTPEQQGMERTRAHNAVIEQMVAEGIVAPSPQRVMVRWLARYFVQTDYLTHNDLRHAAPDATRPQIMFLRRDSFPPKLEALPPYYEQEETSALAFYIPVRVTIEPLLEQNANVEPE